jgi:class 3 adenylate cyclase/tetratricopeptide (TPR) repeat protein
MLCPYGEDVDTVINRTRSALAAGDPFFAYDVARTGLRYFKDNVQLKQLTALALSKTGSLKRAIEILEPVVAAGDNSEDSYGILAAAYKRLWLGSNGDPAGDVYGRKALELYEQGYFLTGGYYTGLNAATMHLFLGNASRSECLAAKVVEQCRKIVAENPEDYWASASLAEALLLTGSIPQAVECYARAKGLCESGSPQICTTRTQAIRIAEFKNCVPEIKAVLSVGSVLIFTGHMIDAPGRTAFRFPPSIERVVALQIAEKINAMNAVAGYSSAACGSDILFIEAMQKRGAETHLILPFRKDDFVKTSINFAGSDWERRFNEVLAAATSVTYATNDAYLGDDILFQYCNQIIYGMGRLRANRLGLDLKMLAVHKEDGTAAVGGTSDMLSDARRFCDQIEIISLQKLVDNEKGVELDFSLKSADSVNSTQYEKPCFESVSQTGRLIRTMLFADVVGFSKLDEAQTERFMVLFQAGIVELMAKSPHKPVFSNTWGDGLFFVFDDVVNGAGFALSLCEMVSVMDWTSHELPEHLDIRISLHAGPVFKLRDPILQKDNYFGVHVARAARIEPITTPGRVYASAQVAAMLAVVANNLQCEYVGNISLSKKYGNSAIYDLRRVG